MQTFRNFWRLRLNAARNRILIFVILIGILPMALVGSWLIVLERRSLQAQTNHELTIVAQNCADRMDSFVANLLNNARASAALPGLINEAPEGRETLLQLLNTHFPDYGQLALVNPSGQLEIVAKPQEMISVDHVPSFQQAIRTQRQAWVIAPAPSGNHLIMHVHTPIFDEAGNLVSVLGSPIPLDNLTAALDKIDSGTAFVLDETGHVLLHPDPAQLEARTDFSQLVFAENGRPPQQAITTNYSRDGNRYVASYAPITSLGWTVVVERSESELLMPITQATNRLILGLVATVFAGLAITILVSGRMTRPMRDLVLAAQAFGEGKPDLPLPQSPWIISEIRILINTFGRMRTAVTERETHLQRSESRIRALIDAMPDTLLRVDANLNILDAKFPTNSPFKQLPGNPVGTDLLAYLRPLGDDTFINQIEQALQETQSTGEAQLVESTLSQAAQKFDIEIRIVPNSEQKEAVLILRDITEQKEAEASIHKLLSALEASSEGLAILDQSQTFVYANNAYAQINGYPNPQELIGRGWTIIYNAEQQRTLRHNIIPNAQENGVWRGEFLVSRPDSSSYLQELALSPLASGEFVCVIRDITERKKSEEAILEAQKLDNLGLLAGGVAHDFNNLLTGILGHSTLALENANANSLVREQLQKVVSSASKAADLTRQLLAYAGKGVFEVQSIDINQLIRENISLLETALPNKAEILLDLEPEVLAVEADSGQIQQVLMNLVINAAESFGKFGGQIQIQTRQCPLTQQSLQKDNLNLLGGTILEPGNYVCLIVADNGCGIEPKQLAHIFDPFFSTKDTGTGLGLSATLGIIRAHHGGIQVQSEVGKGTQFTVYFKTSDRPALQHAQKRPRKRTLSGTALIIDDQETILAVAEDMLTTRGMRVMLAASGPQAIALFQEHHHEIDVILLDLKMPGMGGDEVYPQLKQIDPNARIIIASGYSEQETLNYFANHNEVAFIQKPYRFQALVEMVASVLEQTQ
ncbi:MAG: hypothetical protein CL608_17600 [Anaerolineaceae bacterium]|nr:hypothetical protein [Anaerolineaceae bacterium]